MPILVSTTPPVGPTVPDVLPGSQLQPTMTWTGWTGDSWVLGGNFNSKALLEADGRGGLLMPPGENYSDRSATADGETWQGYSVLPRDVTWPLVIIGDSPQDFRTEHARFLTTLQFGKSGTLTVTHPDGSRRSLQLRYVEGGEGDFGVNAYGISWMRHPVKMRAYDPYFYGDPVTEVFDYSPGVNFYGGGVGTLGPPYHLSSGRTIDSAAITNPGDVDAYGVWKLHGPFTSATVTVGGKQIAVPFARTLGQWVEINTDRRIATIVDQAGANRWGDVGVVQFAPIPASASTTIGINLVSAGAGAQVEFTYTPKHWRAW